MTQFKIDLLWIAAFFLFGVTSLPALAAPPNLQTPAPVIYLADNLDEKDNLGWCIDTVGRGLADRLHAHSCKPFGGDVQFYYKSSTRQIASATFANLCAEINNAGKSTALGLVKCSTATGQKFSYNKETSEFRPISDANLCLAVGKASRSAGPFMSRSLDLARCDAVDSKYRQWIIKGGKK